MPAVIDRAPYIVTLQWFVCGVSKICAYFSQNKNIYFYAHKTLAL